MSSTEAPFSLALRAAPSSNRSRVLRSSAIASKEPKDNSVFSARRRRERENAEQIGGNVSGALDATGCNIGVYYDNAHTGNVTGANIHSANYYGVVVNGDVGAVAVNVTGSAIHDIGESPLTGQGSQHGNAVYDRAFGGTASGTISGNTQQQGQRRRLHAGDWRLPLLRFIDLSSKARGAPSNKYHR